MKLKLSREETTTLVQILQRADQVRFLTNLESKLCGQVMKSFVLTLMRKSLEFKPFSTTTLDTLTILVLNVVLPQISIQNPYEEALLVKITLQVNKQCLSI